jgi:hypothetical protein
MLTVEGGRLWNEEGVIVMNGFTTFVSSILWQIFDINFPRLTQLQHSRHHPRPPLAAIECPSRSKACGTRGLFSSTIHQS